MLVCPETHSCQQGCRLGAQVCPIPGPLCVCVLLLVFFLSFFTSAVRKLNAKFSVQSKLELVLPSSLFLKYLF